ncbi:MAG: ABC transporter ATP-binding protein [Saprospiraceae bacterium]|nr:ABC transporter ATP-binding protein [Saprospiraceae bacterium]MBK8484726.1 ABC transporter ATP-binding protein [Saprospiraceae bacterium]MBK9222152.1 ABC transporter ATP-binding protein [Saprospiraceae bacterium]MBK9720938.1 ABC transporter ATP-binding protein [Saprospiraceae bacterium]MBK9727932.1 ABC transporter ATP-binding protein [Saprospiraceae bacterium]
MSARIDTTLPKIIELQKVSQSYDNGKTYVIKELDLLIVDKPAQGQFITILGASGCGKSTLLRYIAGLQLPTKGEVFIHGKLRNEKDHVGMIFQQYSSFPWKTVLENVATGLEYLDVSPKERTQRALEMIELVGLKGHEQKYAQYPTLSGGQLQRVAIARSLLTNQEILLLDEPFGALDIRTRVQMQELLLEIWHKFHSTFIFVTHDIGEAVYLSDEIYIMKSASSDFVDHILVDLPLDRNRNTKKLPQYLELVRTIEDMMLKISNN